MEGADPDPVAWLLARRAVTPEQVAECRGAGDGPAVIRALVERGYLDPVELGAMASLGAPAPSPPPPPDGASSQVEPSTHPAVQAALAARPLRIAQFEILEELGRGGMGIVYKAFDPRLHRVVALKVLKETTGPDDPRAIRFEREARAAARLQHPGIVQVHEVGEADGVPYIAMEFISGGTLRRAWTEHGRDPRSGARLLMQVAEALAHAHEHGIVHRDMKPENILLDEGGRPRVSDFGLAHEIEAESRMTISGMVLGTPSYMAPEQAEGRRDAIGPPTDVYGLGAVLYELLTGQPPVVGSGIFEMIQQVIAVEVVPPSARNPRVERDLEVICLRCLEKESARRYQNAGELASDLGHYLAGEPILARPVSSMYKVRRWVRRRRTIVVAAALVTAAGALAMAMTWRAHVAGRDRDRGLLESDFFRTTQVALADALARQRSGDVSRLRRVVDEALAGAVALLAREPDLAAAHFVRGWVLRLDGRPSDAEEALSEAIRLRPDDAGARYQRGLVRADLYRAGLDEAWASWASAQRSGSGTTAPGEALLDSLRPGLVAWRTGAEEDFRRLEALAKEGKARELGDGAVQCGKGLLALYRGEIEEGVRLLRASIAEDRFRDEAWDGLVFAARQRLRKGQGAEEDLLAAHDGAIQANRGRWHLWASRADVLGERARRRSAKGSREEAEADWDAALRDLDSAKELAPDRPEPSVVEAGLCVDRARAAAERGAPSEEYLRLAEESASQVLGRHPDYAPAYNHRGNVYSLRGEAEVRKGVDPAATYGKALEQYRMAMRWNSANPIYDNNVAQVSWRLALADLALGRDPSERFSQAVEAAGQAIAKNADYVSAYVSRGNTWQSLGEQELNRGQDPRALFRKAIGDFDEALQRDAVDLNALTGRGNAWLSLANAEDFRGGDGRESYRRAIADFDRALDLSPDSARAFNNRGSAWLGLANGEADRKEDPRTSYGKAIEDFGRALERNPEMTEARLNRGLVRQLLGDLEAASGGDASGAYQEALADYDAILGRNRNYWRAHAHRGLVLQSLKRYPEAVAAFEAAYAIVGDNYPPLKQFLAQARALAAGDTFPLPAFAAAAGRGDTAISAGDHASARTAYEEALVELHRGTGFLSDAEKKAILADPLVRARLQTVRYNLACCLGRGGELDGAFEQLRGAIQAGFSDFDHLERDPDLESLRADMRWKDLRR